MEGEKERIQEKMEIVHTTHGSLRENWDFLVSFSYIIYHSAPELLAGLSFFKT